MVVQKLGKGVGVHYMMAIRMVARMHYAPCVVCLVMRRMAVASLGSSRLDVLYLDRQHRFCLLLRPIARRVS